MIRRLFATLIVLSILPGLTSAPAIAGTSTNTRYEGEIDGARYLVVVPDDWNGTLLLWSHGAYSMHFPEPTRIALTSQPATESWLLDHGYALAASQFRAVRGWSIEHALTDQVRLLDWFNRTIGQPRRTISAGESVGAITATMLAERNPRRFAGVMTFCGSLAGSAAHWNSALDLGFVLRTLLAPDSDIQLVKLTDPSANVNKMIELIRSSYDSGPAGRARIALANAIAQVPGWLDSTRPRPTDPAEQILWQSIWDRFFRAGAYGLDRTDVESWAGGNPSWNVGVDYRRLLARTSERRLVEQAYADAGLDLDADLARLAAEPRIRPDARAVGYLARLGLPIGTNPWPVLTMHNVADGAAPAANERAYAERVTRPTNLRQLYIDRAGHCTFTSSEEITSLRTLLRRIETGRWTDADLNTEAGRLGPDHQLILDRLTGSYVPSRPAFTAFTPDPYPRTLPF